MERVLFFEDTDGHGRPSYFGELESRSDSPTERETELEEKCLTVEPDARDSK
jgi:hypothetical protein